MELKLTDREKHWITEALIFWCEHLYHEDVDPRLITKEGEETRDDKYEYFPVADVSEDELGRRTEIIIDEIISLRDRLKKEFDSQLTLSFEEGDENGN